MRKEEGGFKHASGEKYLWVLLVQQLLPCQAHHWYLVCNIFMICEETVNSSILEHQSGMFCNALEKVIFMYCIAICGMTWDCLNRWWNILLASYQTMLETFGFVSPGLHYIQFCNESWPESAERNPILAGHEGVSGWATSSPQCMLDQMWVTLSSLSQFLSKKYLWKCDRSDWRRQSRLGICIATLSIWTNLEARLIRHKTTSSLSCRDSDVSGRKIN